MIKLSELTKLHIIAAKHGTPLHKSAHGEWGGSLIRCLNIVWKKTVKYIQVHVQIFRRKCTDVENLLENTSKK